MISHAIVISPDKTPVGEYIHRFHAPVVDDVAGIMIRDHTATREIVICRKNSDLETGADPEDVGGRANLKDRAYLLQVKS